MKRLLNILLILSVSIGSIPVLGEKKPSVAIIDFFPFGYTDKLGNPTGLFWDMAEEISQEMGVEFDIQLLPVPRALRDVSSGQIDMLISYKDPLMVPNVEFLGKVGCLTSMLIPSIKHNPENLSDLAKLKVGYITGGYFDKRFSQKLDIVQTEVPSNEAMLTMLIRQRLDAIVINDAVFNAYLHDLNDNIDLPENWKTQVGKSFSVETMETHVSMSDYSQFKNLKPKLKQTISKLFKNGNFTPIYQKYRSGKAIECKPYK